MDLIKKYFVKILAPTAIGKGLKIIKINISTVSSYLNLAVNTVL